MSEEPDVDPADLRADVEQIKAAMGIADRYDQTPQVWLGYALLVGLAATASQLVVLQRLSAIYHTPIWVGIMGGGSALMFRWLDEETGGASADKPLGWLVFAVCFALVVPIQLVVNPFLVEQGYLASTAMVQGLIVVLIGAAYVLMGNLLRAYRIRVLDRATLYAGGLLLVGLGVAIPNVTLLHTWGFGAFGATYVAYALVAYLVLAR